MKLRLHVIVLSGLLFLVLSSCKKEYIDKINVMPGDTIQRAGYTDIRSFEVHEFSNDTVLKASMKGDTIIIYWPSYKPVPASIKPTIALPDSATIAPASGAEVAFQTGTAFKVTAGTGSSRTYILKVDFQQPKPWWSAVFNSSVFRNGSFQVLSSGDFFIPDTALTKVYLVAASGETTYQAEVLTASVSGPGFFIPMDVPEGWYDVKVVNGIHTVYNSYAESRNKFNVSYPTNPLISGAGIPSSIRRNETFVVRGCLLGDMNLAQVFDANGDMFDLEIVSTAIDRIVLKIPADLPLTNYNTILLTNPGGKQPFAVINLDVES